MIRRFFIDFCVKCGLWGGGGGQEGGANGITLPQVKDKKRVLVKAILNLRIPGGRRGTASFPRRRPSSIHPANGPFFMYPLTTHCHPVTIVTAVLGSPNGVRWNRLRKDGLCL